MLAQRLISRRSKDNDFAPFTRLNADHRVMGYFPAAPDRQKSDAIANRIKVQSYCATAPASRSGYFSNNKTLIIKH